MFWRHTATARPGGLAMRYHSWRRVKDDLQNWDKPNCHQLRQLAWDSARRSGGQLRTGSGTHVSKRSRWYLDSCAVGTICRWATNPGVHGAGESSESPAQSCVLRASGPPTPENILDSLHCPNLSQNIWETMGTIDRNGAAATLLHAQFSPSADNSVRLRGKLGWVFQSKWSGWLLVILKIIWCS